jgi:hypothetical protein
MCGELCNLKHSPPHPTGSTPATSSCCQTTLCFAGTPQGERRVVMSSSLIPSSATALTKIQEALVQRNWVKSLRPIQSFASPQSFSVPKSSTEVLARLENNVQFFMSNYLLVCVLTMLYAILFKPILLLLTLFLSGAGYFAFSRDVVELGQVKLQGQKKTLAFLTLALLLVIVFAGSTIFSVFSICLFLVTLHAAFHTSVPNAEVCWCSSRCLFAIVVGAAFYACDAGF